MRFSRRIIIGGGVLAVGAAVGLSLYLQLGTRDHRKPNVLVVSACSLRQDRLGVFNPQSKLTPKIDAWAKGAYTLENGIAERPWQNYTYEGSDILTGQTLVRAGYKNFAEREFRYNFYVPAVDRNEEGIWYWPETAILKYQSSLDELKEAMAKHYEKPFYIFAHLKYMHYPYLDEVNMTNDDRKRLSPRSQQLLQRYLSAPQKFAKQLPLIELLTNSFTLLKKELGVKQDVFAVAGVVSDLSRNRLWRETPDYQDDLRLVQELYDLKMRRFDDMASDVLNLFGSKDLQDRTIVIFTGDHGESFGEHGVIGHSVNVYDEMLRFPVIVKFPEYSGGKRLAAQLNLYDLAKLAEGMVEGRVTADNFAETVAKIQSEYVLSRNCPDTIRSVRYNNEWKFIQNLDTAKNELYDLKADPAEKNNLVEAKADVAWKMEEYLVDHNSMLERENRNGARARVCTAN